MCSPVPIPLHPKPAAAEFAHGEIFSAARATTTARERKWNQTRSLPTAQKRAKGSHPSFWDTTWDKKTLLCKEDNKEDLGIELLCLNTPDSPGHPWLSSQAWGSVPAVLPVGNTEGFKSPAPLAVGDTHCTQQTEL